MIKHLTLSKFTKFAEAEFDFASGINVIIGTNGTGKTHLLKLLFATLKAKEDFKSDVYEDNITKHQDETRITNRLMDCFLPMDRKINRLISRSQGSSNAEVTLSFTDNAVVKRQKKELSFKFHSKSNRVELADIYPAFAVENTSCIYFPPREILSIFDGFISTYDRKEIPYDATYYFLALELDAPKSKGRTLQNIKVLQDLLEKELTESSGQTTKVVKNGNQFFLQQGSTNTAKIEISLAAEGMRKIATLLYLVDNGAFSNQSVLFWDEPEANLNPMLIKVIARLLYKLAEGGVQIFIATHDYLLTHELSLYAQYKRDIKAEPTKTKVKEVANSPEFRFFGLSKDENGYSKVESADTISGIQNDAILTEFAAYYDLERKLSLETFKQREV